MTTFGSQFNGLAHPKPRGGDHGGGRPPDGLHPHPEHGKVGTLSAIARDLGVEPAALHIQRTRRGDFPEPVMGHMYSRDAVADFRGCGCEH
jgi:hypothetical protein